MTETTEHVASCSCEQLQVTLLGDPDMVVACNCTRCQKRSGSPFGVGAYYRRDRVRSVEGQSKDFDRVTDSGRGLSTKFCPDCGTSVYWSLDMRPDHYGIAIGCITDPAITRPARVVWAQSKHDWIEFPEDMPVFDQAAT